MHNLQPDAQETQELCVTAITNKAPNDTSNTSSTSNTSNTSNYSNCVMIYNRCRDKIL